MAITNFDHRELTLKLLYCGGTESGKTDNLTSLVKILSPEIRAGVFGLNESPRCSEVARFECLPLTLGYVKDYQLKLNLYTLPAEIWLPRYYGTLIAGVDGIVFVFSSLVRKLRENLAAYETLRQSLQNSCIQWGHIPLVVQFNKVDSGESFPVELLREEFSTLGESSTIASAQSGEGVLETLKDVVSRTLKRLNPNEDV